MGLYVIFVPVGWKDYARSRKTPMAFFLDAEQLLDLRRKKQLSL